MSTKMIVASLLVLAVAVVCSLLYATGDVLRWLARSARANNRS